MRSIRFLLKTSISVIGLYTLLFTAIVEASTPTGEQVMEKLQSLDNKNPLKVRISKSSENTAGLGEDLTSSKVSLEIGVELKQGDLIIHYPHELLERIDKERRANEENPDSPMPIQLVSSSINIHEIQSMFAAHEQLIHNLKTSTLVSQSNSRYKDHDATLMEFDLKPNFSKRKQKYIKKYSAKLKLWLDEKGWPIACESYFWMKWRAYMVVNFEWEETDTIEYQVYKNRLVATYIKSLIKNSGGGESGENKATTTLSISTGD